MDTTSPPSALEWTFSFAPADITSVSVSAGSALTAAGKSISCNNGSGMVKCLASGMNSTGINNGIVAVASATLASNTSTPSVPLGLTGPLGAMADGSAAAILGTGGTISVSGWQSPALQALNCSPASVVTPGSSSCTVTLSGAAPAGGVTVVLSASPLVSVPPSVAIAAGVSSASFTASIAAVPVTQIASITATLNANLQTSSLTLQPPGVPAGLVAAYGFEEGSGITAADASGSANTGTISNATWGGGKFGNALVFNGTNSIVSIVDSPALHLTTGMTLEAWVKPSAVNNAWTDVLYKGNDAYFLEATSDSNFVPAGGGTFGGTGAAAYGAIALPLNVWTHLAETYDGQSIYLYVNGVPASIRAQTGSILTSANPLQIGGDSLFGQYFAGTIDEVRVYNLPLTQAQIQSDMITPVVTGTLVSVNSLQCSSNTVAASSSSTCWVTLSQAAPAGGSTVTLSDNNTALTVPATVTVASGNSTAYFTVSSGAVPADTAVTITATLNGSSKTTVLTITAPPNAVSGVQCSSNTVPANSSSTCWVMLSQSASAAGVTVTLSDNNTALTIPATVTVASGNSTAYFTVSAGSVPANTGVTITASLNGSSQTTVLTIVAGVITVSGVQCSSNTIAAGSTSTCWVTLSQSAPAGGAAVSVSDNNPALTVPASVTVASGNSTAYFNVSAGSVATNTAVTITASFNGGSQTALLTITVPSNSLSGLQCSSNTIPANSSSTCWVTLAQAAASGGVTVTLSDNNTALTVPGSVTVASGNSTAYFNVTAGSVAANTSVTITGSLSGSTAAATVTIQPAVTADPSLVAAYSFAEGLGASVADSSGKGNGGTITNATWTASGKYGNALLFNGVNSLVTINDSPSLHLSTAITIEAWVQPTAVNNAWSDVVYKGTDAYFLEATSDKKSVPAAGATLGGKHVNTVAYGSSALAANSWTHLAQTYDGATLRLYVNGVQVSSRAQTGNILTTTNPLQIGGDSIYGQYFKGVIDEVRVYNRALSQAEIQKDASTPITR